MSTSYTYDENTTVARDGRSCLSLAEVREFLTHALRRKLRKRGDVDGILAALGQKGRAFYSWNFAAQKVDPGKRPFLEKRRYRKDHRHWVTLRIIRRENGFTISLVGPMAQHACQRVTAALERNALRKERMIPHRAMQKKKESRSARRKRLKLEQSQALRQGVVPQRKKKRHPRTSAPISLEYKERMIPQFRKNRISWNEAISTVVYAFEVRASWKYTSRQLVRRRLLRSLDQNGGRFAQFKRNGFCVRFDLVDGRWRGDITPLAVYCTKNNTDPVYRRMRARLADMLLGLSPQEHRKRRVLLWSETMLRAA